MDKANIITVFAAIVVALVGVIVIFATTVLLIERRKRSHRYHGTIHDNSTHFGRLMNADKTFKDQSRKLETDNVHYLDATTLHDIEPRHVRLSVAPVSKPVPYEPQPHVEPARRRYSGEDVTPSVVAAAAVATTTPPSSDCPP
jgi:hypothetical protein